MASNPLTEGAKRENAVALAAALGLDINQASAKLELSITITADRRSESTVLVAQEIQTLLSRTVGVNDPEESALEVVVGAVSPRTPGPHLFVSLHGKGAVCGGQSATGTAVPIPPVLCLLIACYASGAALNRALGSILPYGASDPLVLDFNELGLDYKCLQEPIDIGRSYLAGAGAIGNGFLWAARHLTLLGQLDVVDDDFVSDGNLNRQIWFGVNDVGQPKAGQLTKLAQSSFSRLRLIPRQCRLQELPECSEGAWLERLIVGVDSRRARRKLQNEFPGEVFDASTTDIREAVIHYNRQPTQMACLSCIYEPDSEEISREAHIAGHLGVSVEEVKRERITRESALIIGGRFPNLSADSLEGMAYDTLFKKLCAESQLRTAEGKRIIAPFAFVSVLAGTMLALEVARRLGAGQSSSDFNYWRLSAWHPPLGRRRLLRPKQPACKFCGNKILRSVNQQLWKR